MESGEFLTEEEQQSFFQGIGSQERESFQRGIGDVSAFDLGGGRFVAQQMAQQEAIAERRGKAQDKLRAAEAQAREAAEEEVDLLKSAQQDRKRAMTTAVLGGVATVAATAADIKADSLRREAKQALLDIANQNRDAGRALTAAQMGTFQGLAEADGGFDPLVLQAMQLMGLGG